MSLRMSLSRLMCAHQQGEGVDHVIRLQQGSSPSFMRPFRMSKHEEEECMKQVQDALGKGFRAKLFSVWCSIAFCIKNGWELENVH